MSKPKRNKKRKPNDPHFAREKAKYGKPIASREHILDLLQAEKAPLKFDALALKLGLDQDETDLDALRRRVRAMLRDGQLIENRRGGLVPVNDSSLIAGRISAHPDGFGFLIADEVDPEGDIYLSAKQMRLVLHSDRVVVSVIGVDRRGRREGRIAEVIERANKSVVGRLTDDKGVFAISPDNKRLHLDILVPPLQLGGAKKGDIVVAEIIEQPSRKHPPLGRVIEVLGKHMEPGMEIDMSLRSHDIPFDWPEEVTGQAAAITPSVQPNDKLGRKDVTRLPLVTIDGADARDFDDAVYCEADKDGWRLLVAIADVAHYVPFDTPLDVEAQKRGTSVYFPGRVVPMLPEVLSNGLCSINPGVERLCMLCELSLDSKGGIKRTRFYNGVMLSHARLTYDQVNNMLTNPDGDLATEHSELLPHLQSLHTLYKVLAANRQKRGAIEFDSTETRIVFDDKKKIKEIVPVIRNDAHKLIEECMILANSAAAGYLEQSQIPALYRVHHGPKADRLEDLRAFLSLHGLSLTGGINPTALDYAALAKQLDGRPDRSVISTMMLRSMQQAVYQPRNDGHFGLAITQYAHFTSPIRRYPDLLVHRAIKHMLRRESVTLYRYSKEQMAALGESCSMTERRADEATRDVVSWLKCEYMQDHIGTEYPGVITAVTSFGLFVELQGIHVEGLVHVTNLSRDYYRYEQAAQAMIGERTGTRYKLGDEIQVLVQAVNLEERKIDFGLAGAEGEKKASEQHSKKRKKPNKTDRKSKHAKAPETAGAVAVAADTQNANKQNANVSAKKKAAVKQRASDVSKVSSKKTAKIAAKTVSKTSAKVSDAKPSKLAPIASAKKQSKVAAKVSAKKQAKVAAKLSAKKQAKVAAKVRAKKQAKVAAKVSAKKQAKVAAKVSAKKQAKVAAKVSAKKQANVAAKVSAKKQAKVAAKVSAKKKAKVSAKATTKKKAKASASANASKKLASKKKATAKKAGKKARSKRG